MAKTKAKNSSPLVEKSTKPAVKNKPAANGSNPKASDNNHKKLLRKERRQARREERRADRKNNKHGSDNSSKEEALGLEDEGPPNSEAEENQALEEFKSGFESTHGVNPITPAGEVDYSAVNDFSPNTFFDPLATGNPNKALPMSEEIVTYCQHHTAQNPNGITFVQPSSPNELGAVLFNGQACSGVKRRDGNFNNWPSESVNGKARMTPDGLGKHSDNFKDGDYGPSSDASLKPIWLGNSGSVQIHSLSRLTDDASLAGVSSLGCLVVNQNCMRAINAFVGSNKNLDFTIIPSSQNNDLCTRAVNAPQSF